MDRKRRSAYVSQSQKQKLREIIDENNHLNEGTMKNNFTPGLTWNEVALQLNSMGGAVKDDKGWRKTWQDMKRNVKEKVARISFERNQTGGGPSDLESVTEEEEAIIPFIGESAIVGLPIVESDIFESTSSSRTNETAQFEVEKIKVEPVHPDNKLDGIKKEKKTKADRILEIGKLKADNKKEYYREKIEILKQKQAERVRYNDLYQRNVEAQEKIAESLQLIAVQMTTNKK